MANKLFQQARDFVEEVLHKDKADEPTSHGFESNKDTMDIAKNALSSAFANSTDAERAQLSELQEELETKHE